MHRIPYGLAVRIPGFHPGGPGSTPGMGKRKFPFFKHLLLLLFSSRGLNICTESLKTTIV